MKFLFKVAKMLPRLSTESEIVPTIRAIERIMKAESLDWHDVAEALTNFVTTVAGADEATLPPPPPPPEPEEVFGTGFHQRAGAWSTVNTPPPPRGPQPGRAPNNPQGFGPAPGQAPGAGPYQAPPRGPQVDRRMYLDEATQLSVVKDLLSRRLWNTPAEQNVLIAAERVLFTGFPLKPKSFRDICEMSKRL